MDENPFEYRDVDESIGQWVDLRQSSSLLSQAYVALFMAVGGVLGAGSIIHLSGLAFDEAVLFFVGSIGCIGIAVGLKSGRRLAF